MGFHPTDTGSIPAFRSNLLSFGMPRYLDPATLEGQQLTLHEQGEGDYAVRVLDHVVGRIMAKPIAGGRLVWFWTITGPYIPADLLPSNGDADTLLEAKAAFRAKFDAWLAWAKDLAHPVTWMS